jgi:hypothetical protein
VNPDASRSFAERGSDDYARHGSSDRAGSFGNAGWLHVALAAGRPARSCQRSKSGLGRTTYRPAPECGTDHTGKIAQPCYPARPDMDEVHDGWNTAPACVHQHDVGHGADLRLGS